MELQTSKREQVKLRIGLSGASGFGKTYSALLLAYGITKNWSKIAVIDTENASASLYAHLGNFKVLNLVAPFSPTRYIEAINLCQKNEEIEVLIIDSISQEWQGVGGCLQMHKKYGARFQDWAKVTIEHQAFIDAILQARCHVITTTRRKTHYSLDINPNNGKAKVVKLGTKEITREGWEYELTVNFELINQQHQVVTSKDRTGLFLGVNQFVITPKTGEQLLKWCHSKSLSLEEITAKIDQATSLTELAELYKDNPKFQEVLQPYFKTRKAQLNSKSTQNGNAVS